MTPASSPHRPTPRRGLRNRQRRWPARLAVWLGTAALIGSALPATAHADDPKPAPPGQAKKHQPGVTIPALAPRPTLDKKVAAGTAATGPTGPSSAPSQNTKTAGASGAASTSASASASATGANQSPTAKRHAAENAAIATARKTGKATPVAELTTETSTTVANADGTLTAAISPAPVRTDINGSWQPIDTTLAKAADGTWQPKAAVAHITLSPGGDGPLAAVTLGGRKTALSWPLGPLPKPVIDGATATYAQVLPGVDLRVSAAADGISEVLVVADARAAANPALKTLRFGITGDGLTLKTTSTGGLSAVDQHGHTVFTGPPPAMWDSSGVDQNAADLTAADKAAAATAQTPSIADAPRHGAKTAVMPLQISGTSASIVPDQSLLTDPGTKYPVYIDPTIAGGNYECTQIYAGKPSYSDSCGSLSTLGNLNVMRAGYDASAGTVGAVRSMFSFDVVTPLTTNNPYNSIPGAGVADDPAVGYDNITDATLNLTVHNAPNCNANGFWIYRTGPIYDGATNWANDVTNNATGSWGQMASLLNPGGAISAGGCADGATLSVKDTAQVQSVFANNYYQKTGTPEVTLGIRMDQEASAGNYWSFYFTNPANIAQSATLNITYRPDPYVADGSLTTTPPMTFHGAVSGTPNCDNEVNNVNSANTPPTFGGIPSTIGYVGKNFDNQVVLHANIGDADPVTANGQFQFADVTTTATNANLTYAQILPPSGFYTVPAGGPVGTTNPADIVLGPMTSTAIAQNNGATPLIDGHIYRYSAYVYDPAGAEFTEINETCYFMVAFNAPKAPYVTAGGAPDFPQLGNPSAANMYATLPSAKGITIQADTAGVNIDHFEYVINDDSSKIPSTPSGGACNNPSNNTNNPANSGCVSASMLGSGNAGISAQATIPVPTGVTTMGTNTVWIRAVDDAGNVSPVGSYQFYLPGKPTAVPTLGDITGDGVPDILAVEPDPVGGARLMTFPGNTDPNLLGTIDNAVEAAPATAAPDGLSWADTLITHRGALRGVAVDDLFAYSKTNKALYYYLNSDIFGGVVKKDMYALNHKVVITRPVCNPLPANSWCAGGSYSPDWSKVTQILAFGNAAGGKPGSFAGRTNLITVEDNGNHGANVWMFSPGAGLGQLANPVLLSSVSTNTGGDYNSGNQLSWLNADLIAPGINPGGTLPNLWARDRLTGNLWQFTNLYGANNAEDPTSLGNLNNATVIGTKGAYGVGTYANLLTAGNPNVANGSGALSQNGYPALWDIESSGTLKLLPGSANGPLTPVNGTWPTTRSSWTNVNSISSVDGSPITLPAGPILLGEGQTAGNPQLCMDLQNNNDNPDVPVWTYGCNGQGAQDWIVDSDGTIRYSADQTECLEVANSVPGYPVLTPFKAAAGNFGDNAGTMQGAPIQINKCTLVNGLPAANQQWILRPSQGALNAGQHGWYNIYNPNSARCLDSGYDTTSTQQQLWIWDCLDSQAQQFQAPAAAGTWMNVSAGALAPWAPTPVGTTSISGDTYTLTGAVNSSYGLNWYVPYESDYYIESSVNTGPGNGIMQASIDGGPELPFSVDTYAPAAGTASAYYGTQHLTVGYHKFMFTVTGKNAASSGYQLALTHLSIAPSFGVGPTSSLKVTTATTPQAIAPATFGFDASKSFPGGGAIATYTFDFGDGTPPTAGTAATASHTYAQGGYYTAKVTVTDANQVSSTATQEISVAPPAPTTLTSSDGTTTAACVSTASSAPTMASLTPTLSAAMGPGLAAQFEVRDLTDPSLAPPIAIGGTGSTGSTAATSTLVTPGLVNGHEYAYAARASDGTGTVSPISAPCYFWALTSGSQAIATGAAGLPFDNTFYPASSAQTWTGPLTTLKWANGTLSLYRNSDNALMWGAGAPSGAGTNVLALQSDGNLVIYKAQPSIANTGAVSGTAVWSTSTNGHGATALLLAVDGSLTVRAGTTTLWSAPIAAHIWPLNEGQGLTAADTGFAGGSPGTLDTSGVSWPGGSYVTFAGTTARIATAGPVLDTTKSFTVSAWVNLATTGSAQTMLVQQAGTNSAFYLEYNGSTWQFAMPATDTTSPPITRITSTAPAAAGAWTHLIGTYDATSGRMALYVNGVPNSTGTVANSIASPNMFAMGRGFWGGVTDNRLNGSLADVRVFQQAVSDSQATSIYQTSAFAKPAIPGVAGALISGDSAAPQQICLDDLNGNLANSTTVIDVYACNGTWPQAWQFAADGTVRIMGTNPANPPNKCLDTGGINTQGSKVTLYDCQAGNGNQQWKAVPSSSTPGQVSLVNPPTGLCLDNSNGATNNTNPFQLYACLDNANQHFTLPAGPGQNQGAEAESLWGSASGGTMTTQANCCGGSWSNGAQEMLVNSVAGSTMTLNFYVADPGLYIVAPTMTKAVDYGQVSVSIDGSTTALPSVFDGWQASGVSTTPFHFGTVNLTAGMHSFVFKATGTNTASTGNRYNLGVDVLTLIPTPSGSPYSALSVTNPGIVNQPVLADASASSPSEAAITGYTFDFGDGTVVGPQPGGTASHLYSTAGTYVVKATVTDANNAGSFSTRKVIVLSGPPVANGDFETGTLAGWGAAYNSGITTSNPHSGTYAGQINAPTGGNGSIEQVVTGLKPNTSYTLTGWIRTDGGITHLGTKQYNAADDDTGDTTTATTWTQLSNTFTTGPTNTSVDIYCYRSTAGTSACDDFTLLATPAAATVGNGDFETGNLAGWNAAYNSGVTTTNPHSGTYAGQINAPTGGNGSIEQVVTGLTPNTSYTLTGWIRTDGGITHLGTKQYNAADDDTGDTTTATTWTQLSNTFTTGPTNTSVDIYCYRSTAGTSACDDFSLARTPATVANPDFESGSLAGWGASYNSAITTTNPHGGTYAGQLNATTGNNASVEQVVTGLAPNTAYTLTGWVRTDGGVTYLGAKQYDATTNTADSTTTATGWTQLTDQFTTGATNTSVDIYCYRNTAGTSACDDITLAKS